MHTHLHTYIHTYIRTYMYAYINTFGKKSKKLLQKNLCSRAVAPCMFMYVCMCISVYACVLVYKMHTHLCSTTVAPCICCMCACVYVCMYVRLVYKIDSLYNTYVCIHTCIHAHAHTHTYQHNMLDFTQFFQLLYTFSSRCYRVMYPQRPVLEFGYRHSTIMYVCVCVYVCIHSPVGAIGLCIHSDPSLSLATVILQ
jgi:hypothetical protein